MGMRRKAAKLTVFLVLFAAGVAVAGLVAARGVADTTTETLTETATTVETTTEPGQTVVTTATVEQTTTRKVILPGPTTSTATTGSSSSGTPTWVWVLLGGLALAVAVLAVVLLTRRGGGETVDRAGRLDGALGSWLAQGYALESRSATSAVVRRGAERIMISVDPTGTVSSQSLATDEWPTR